ncbi:hypothetical protein ACJIZ3_023860 [Penstemon smallii]|uniref:TF-B3 domain-containing protein n=1 Tax=Penstemon smallii TaxID=265156 RepID=A0ABD3TQ83_9LAMI
MGEECMQSRKCEEGMYWSNFQTVRFCQILSGRFHQQLSIPTKFTNNLRDKLTGPVALGGPSGSIWYFGLLTAFVEDHSLEENEILIFKYNGNTRFDVLIFDHENLCDSKKKKKYSHSESVCSSKRKRSIEKNDVEQYQAKKQKSVATRSRPSRRQPTQANSRDHRRTIRGRRGSSCAPSMELKSRRRAVTLEKKEKAQTFAIVAAVEDIFIVVMLPSQSTRVSSWYNSIPSEWLKKLQIDKTKYHYKGYGGAIWEFYICLFNLVSQKSDAIILDIKFRIIEEVIPPSNLFAQPKSRDNGRGLTSNGHTTSESEE